MGAGRSDGPRTFHLWRRKPSDEYLLTRSQRLSAGKAGDKCVWLWTEEVGGGVEGGGG